MEDGNTVSDYEPEEIKRGGSIQTTLVSCGGDGYKANFLDTPGYDDFFGEVVSALRVVESATILLAATSGVDVGTERSWQQHQEHNLPCLLLVNKMDRENASFARTVADIQGSFGSHCVPFQLPIGEAQDFKGVVSVVNPPAEIPAEVADQFEAARERLIEAVAEADDALADKYLEGEELTPAEIIAGAKAAILSGALVPILACSATQNLGVSEYLDTIRDFFPSPEEGAKPALQDGGGKDVDLAVDPAGPLAAFVFKTTADPFVGKLSLFRVYRGSIASNSEVWNGARNQNERIGQLYLPRGKSQENIAEVTAGDMGAIGKLAATVTGDTLSAREQPVAFARIAFPRGYYSVAVAPATKADLDKMSTSLARIVEEDPSLRYSRDADTGDSLLTGLGDAQIEVAIDRIKRKFGADLVLRRPRVAYRETITRITNTEYRHKKQSGGHGQYGHVLLRLEPMERDNGFEFGSEVVGGRVPREYIPAVEKGRRQVHGGGRSGRLPGGGLENRHLRRQLPRRGLLRDVLRDCQLSGFQEGHGGRQPHPAGADCPADGECAGCLHRGNYERPERQARPHPGDDSGRQLHGGRGRSSPVRSAALLPGYALPDPGPGQLPNGV